MSKKWKIKESAIDPMYDRFEEFDNELRIAVCTASLQIGELTRNTAATIELIANLSPLVQLKWIELAKAILDNSIILSQKSEEENSI